MALTEDQKSFVDGTSNVAGCMAAFEASLSKVRDTFAGMIGNVEKARQDVYWSHWEEAAKRNKELRNLIDDLDHRDTADIYLHTPSSRTP